MKPIEKQLEEYRMSTYIEAGSEEKVFVLKQSKNVFFYEIERRPSTWFSFIYQQLGFVQKKWWLIQLLILVLLYLFLRENQGYLVQRVMGIMSSIFVLLIVPELWKNRKQSAMEIEGACYYSLRQIYMARMMIFAVLDGLLLCAFSQVVIHTTSVLLTDIVCQFLLPMIVTCCICLRMLCSKSLSSEYMAIFLSMFWTAIWTYIILRDSVYQVVSLPLWLVICAVTLIYLIYAIHRLLKECDTYWEVNRQ